MVRDLINFNSVVHNSLWQPCVCWIYIFIWQRWLRYLYSKSSNGAFIWAKTVGGGYDEIGTKIVRTFDGGYVVAGYTKSFVLANEDFYIIKINSSGSLLWTRTIGGPNLDIASDLVQTTDSGYVMSGRTNSFGDQNVYVVKVNSTGVLQWRIRVVEKSGFEAGFSILQTSDGGYLVCGYDNGGGNVYLVKLDAAGTVCNNSTTGGTTSSGVACGFWWNCWYRWYLRYRWYSKWFRWCDDYFLYCIGCEIGDLEKFPLNFLFHKTTPTRLIL